MYPEASVLTSLGVELLPGPIPLPLYARKEMKPTPDRLFPGLTVYQVVDVDPDLQCLMRILLQVTDGGAFRRYVACEKKWNVISLPGN
jgi:hypothetical protein